MHIATGTLLISQPSLEDANFEQSVVFITEHNSNGAIGFVINNPFARPLNALVEFKHALPFPLYNGGPVEREHLFFIHQRPDLITDGTLARGNIYVGGNFKQAVQHINQKNILANDIKIFVGYCGWDKGQLEEEIAEGSWLIIDGNNANVFSTGTNMLWKQLYEAKR
jgi:putative transcriptional regulator